MIKVKNILTGMLLFSVMLNTACTKPKNIQSPDLPWKFTLTDSNLQLYYKVDAGTYGSVNDYDYSTFESSGSATNTYYQLQNIFRHFQTKATPINFSINLSFLDSVTAKQLLQNNSTTEKQIALKNIFAKDKIFNIINASTSSGLLCNYTDENNLKFSVNVFNPVCSGNIKITDALIWDDGSGKAKIKVSITYNFTLQALSNGSWLSDTKKVSGTMQTFFTVQ